jgi:putative transposase
LTSQHRSSQRYHRRTLADELLLRERLRLLARRHPRYGYRRIHALLRREGWACNRKRVQRLWRDEGLRLPPKPRRRRRGKRMPGHLTADCPDQIWALDFLVDQTADGRPIKILTVTDEHTREALATRAARRLGADDTVEMLERIVERRGQAPQLIRCDNGPELVAHALKDWCRFAGVQAGYIEPGAPWQNPYIESFNGHLRRELLDLESFNTLYEAPAPARGLAARVQPLPTSSILELPNPRRVRALLEDREDGKATRTLITTGPKDGVRSPTRPLPRMSPGLFGDG